MIRPTAKLGPLLAVLMSTLLAACADNPFPPACGGDVPPGDPPPVMLGDFPRLVNTATASIGGWRPAGASVRIGSSKVVSGSCDHFWQTDVALVEGDNPLTLVAQGKNLNRSAPVNVTITRDTTPPGTPVINALGPDPLNPLVATTAQGTIGVTGSRDPGHAVYLNGTPLVQPLPGETGIVPIPFSAEIDLPLANSLENLLDFTQVDPAGNAGPAVQAKVTRSGTLTSRPPLVYPLNRQKVQVDPISGAVQLRFGRVPEPGSVFHLQVATGPDFGTLLMDITPLSLFVDFLPPNTGLNGGSNGGPFYWRVGTVDALTGAISYAPARRFSLGPVAGDVNGDGLVDVVVGNPGQDRVVTDTDDNRGGLRLFLGKTDLGAIFPEVDTLRVDGPQSGAVFGIAVTGGDLNNDGFADMIGGAHLHNTALLDTGAVHILNGGASPDAIIDLTLPGQNSGDSFGATLASDFDFNGDGIDDLAVGAWQYDATGLGANDDRGRVYLWFGGTPMDDVPDLIFTGASALENFGSAIAGGFDLNGDGYDDLAIGAPFAAAGPKLDAGRVAVYYGGPLGDTTVDRVLLANLPFTGEHLGLALANAGDMDGDGFDELAAGAPKYAPGGNQSQGRMLVFAGAANPVGVEAFSVNGITECEAFALTLSGGKDLNGDGLSDLAVGVPFSNLAAAAQNCADQAGDQGLVQVHFGADPLINAAQWGARFTGEAANDRLGFGLHLSGDVNGDGTPDLIAGAPHNDLGSPIFGNTGRGYVLFGPGDGSAGITPWAAAPNRTNISHVDPSSGTALDGAALTNDGGIGDGMGTAIH